MHSKQPSIPIYLPRFWLHWAALWLLFGISRLPWRWQLGLGRSLGHLAWWLARSRRKVALRNLEICFPELSILERESLAHRHFASMGMGLVELGMAWWSPKRVFKDRLKLEGLENIHAALAHGKGVMIVGAHYTPMDICGRLFAEHVDIDVLYRRNENPVIESVMRRHRERYFGQAIARDDIRRMVRSLREGRAVWYAPDQNYRGKYSAMVPFFGEPAPTNTATSRLASMTNAAVVSVYMERQVEEGNYLVRFAAPLENFPSDDPIADTVRLNSLLETNIRECPEQYFWVHKRFKKRPEGYVNVYR